MMITSNAIALAKDLIKQFEGLDVSDREALKWATFGISFHNNDYGLESVAAAEKALLNNIEFRDEVVRRIMRYIVKRRLFATILHLAGSMVFPVKQLDEFVTLKHG